MARVKTFTNGGSLLPGDLNSIEDDHEFAFSTYKATAFRRLGVIGATPAAGTYWLREDDGAALAPATGLSAEEVVYYIDPADFLANTRTTKYRVRAQILTNAVAPATTWTFGLYPASTWGGASGTNPSLTAIGAVVAGSTVAIATPAATSQNQGNSGDFTAPAAGFYVLAVVNSGAAAAGSSVALRAELQVRQV